MRQFAVRLRALGVGILSRPERPGDVLQGEGLRRTLLSRLTQSRVVTTLYDQAQLETPWETTSQQW
jgi:hypothetical protein